MCCRRFSTRAGVKGCGSQCPQPVVSGWILKASAGSSTCAIGVNSETERSELSGRRTALRRELLQNGDHVIVSSDNPGMQIRSQCTDPLTKPVVAVKDRLGFPDREDDIGSGWHPRRPSLLWFWLMVTKVNSRWTAQFRPTAPATVGASKSACREIPPPTLSAIRR